jgi:molybdenum cofactor synthesis domain-containing protein
MGGPHQIRFSLKWLTDLRRLILITVAEALKIVLAESPALAAEMISLDRALGRTLAVDIVADTDLPPFDRAQMDGYAVRSQDIQNVPARLHVVGEAAAGRSWSGEVKAGEAVRIMTGAPVPAGADAVQQVEVTREEADGSVIIEKAVEAGKSIVPRASEVKAQTVVLKRGERINAAMTAVLAAFGYAQVKVYRRPRVTVMATGSELVQVTEKPGPDQIRDSNSYSIAAYAQLAGARVKRQPVAADDLKELQEQITRRAADSDVLILSGGVSMGVYDFTKTALREAGAEIFFERVALRPGKPTVFARLGRTLIFGLPGNPVSVSVTFNLFARTALLAMQGNHSEPFPKLERALLSRPAKGAAKRESYLPAQLSTNDQGQLLAEPLRWGGSSDFVAFARATALIIIPPDAGLLESGTPVSIMRLSN